MDRLMKTPRRTHVKKTIIALIAVLAVTLLAGPVVAAHRSDFRTIQKAVKQNPAYEEGKEVRWFKVLVTDGKSGETKVKVTLPIALIDLILSSAAARHVKIDESRCEIDLWALWMELKKAGPMALIEIQDDGALIKVWLE
jgi:hypothetical protein